MLSDRCLVLSVCLSCLYVTLMYCGETIGRIKMPLGTEEDPAQATLCLMGTELPQKGAQPSNFRPISVVAKRSPISSTAELLFHFTYYFI